MRGIAIALNVLGFFGNLPFTLHGDALNAFSCGISLMCLVWIGCDHITERR